MTTYLETISNADFSASSVVVLGFGSMGSQYVKALKALGVNDILVCTQSEARLGQLKEFSGVKSVVGGYANLDIKAKKDHLAIIATPVEELIPAALHLYNLGFRRFLIEKPISLNSTRLKEFVKVFAGVDAVCGYNRVAYPSVLKALKLIEEEGGATSCHYTITEIVKKDWPERFAKTELAKWGIANTIHVLSMAHRIIGFPRDWHTYVGGAPIEWHPSGSVFVGGGISEFDIPFSYHGDWQSTGRWSVEIHTKKTSYRMCPLEKLYCRPAFNAEWTEIPLEFYASEVKVGFVEQVAAMLNEEVRKKIPLMSLPEAFELTRFAESMFGYAENVLCHKHTRD